MLGAIKNLFKRRQKRRQKPLVIMSDSPSLNWDNHKDVLLTPDEAIQLYKARRDNLPIPVWLRNRQAAFHNHLRKAAGV